MADRFDPANEQSPTKLAVLGGKPSIDELLAAIRAANDAQGLGYTEQQLQVSTKNDLIFIARGLGLDVPGLPGADAYPVADITITVQPSNESVADEGDAVFAVSATFAPVDVDGPGSVVLQVSEDDGETWATAEDTTVTNTGSHVNGATVTTWVISATFEAATAMDGNQYRFAFLGRGETVYSDAADLEVTA